MEIYPEQSIQRTNNLNFLNRKRKHVDTDCSDDEAPRPKSQSPMADEDRRAHHNELERRRRDHIKDHFMALKEVIPNLDGEKSSRAIILKRATDYIKSMHSKFNETNQGLAELKRRNQLLEAQLKERSVSNSPPSLSPISTATACVPCVPTAFSQAPQASLPSMSNFVVPTITSTPTRIPTSSTIPSLDTLRLNGLLPPSPDNLFALTQMLLNQARYTAKPPQISEVIPELQSRLLSNALRAHDQKLASTIHF